MFQQRLSIPIRACLLAVTIVATLMLSHYANLGVKAGNLQLGTIAGDRPANRRYAMATLVLNTDYEDSAMALCSSIISGFPDNSALPPYLDVVAFIPEDAHERGIDIKRLECCFSRVKTLSPITVSQPPSFERFKEQYIKLHLWQQTEYERLVYMDADFVVVQVERLVDVLVHSRIAFGAVQDWEGGAWARHWNGGLLLLEPSLDTYNDLMANVEPFIEQQRFDTRMAEQGYLSAYFDHLGFTLPTTYNLNLAIKYQAPEVWERYADRAVAIHYTWVKPWQAPDEDISSEPFLAWWTQRRKVDVLCPRAAPEQ